MARLVARSPAEGLVPVRFGETTLSEVSYDVITSVSPFAGQETAVSAALKEQLGAAWPAPGRATRKAATRVAWAGLGEALVLGGAVDITGAACVDQSDAWAVLALEGPEAEAVLARLCPLDLREGYFKRGHTARSLLGHMSALFLRTGAERFELILFRSMAATAAHELSRAMENVAAQSG